MAKSNLIVSADNNFKVSDLFKVSSENIIGDSPISVSPQYEDYDFNKIRFMGSGEFTGIYRDDIDPDGQIEGNSLGCRGVYVIGVYSATTGANSIYDKEITLYLSDKQLSELQSGTSLLKQFTKPMDETTKFNDSYYTNKDNLITHLTNAFSSVTDAINFSYTSKNHYTDSLQFIQGTFDDTYCSATFKWTNKIMHIFNTIFANDPRTEKKHTLRTYDTALYTYDMLDFGLCEIYPTCFAVGTTNTVAGDGAIVTGVSSKAMGAFSAAFGRYAEARGYSTFAAGHQSKALIEKSVALGDQCSTKGTGSFAAGYQCSANGEYSVAIGDRSNANVTRSFAIGRKNNTYSDYSVAIGDECTTNGDYSVALGTNIITSKFKSNTTLITKKQTQVIVGSYNYENESARFAVGGGEEVNTNYKGDDNKTYTEIIRRNIFEVTSDGKIIVPLYNPSEKPIVDNNGNPKCGYIFLCKDSSGVSLRCAEINTDNKRYKKVWRNNSTGEVIETDPRNSQ